jgi:hypothetical protein
MENQERLYEQQQRLAQRLDDVVLTEVNSIKEIVKETHHLQNETARNLPDLLKSLNAFTEAALSKDKDSKKKKVVNPPKKRGGKKDEDEEYEP